MNAVAETDARRSPGKCNRRGDDSAARERTGRLARIIHDGSSRKRRVTWRDRRAEPGGPDAYSCSTLRVRGASPPAEGPS